MPSVAQDLPAAPFLVVGQREQKMLGRDVVVLQALGLRAAASKSWRKRGET